MVQYIHQTPSWSFVYLVLIIRKEYGQNLNLTKFKERFKSGEVIPIILNTAPLGIFDSATKVGHIDWDRKSDFGTQVQSVTDVLIRKSVEIRGRKKRDAEQALAASPRG